jgi:hypothetical protein
MLKEIENCLTSTTSHECGHTSHPAGCRCGTYDLSLPTPVSPDEMVDIFTQMVGQENF